MNEFPSHKIIKFKQLFLVVELQASGEIPCNILLEDNFLELSRRDSKKLRNVTGSRKKERKKKESAGGAYIHPSMEPPPPGRYFRGPAVSWKLQAKTLQAFRSVKKSNDDVDTVMIMQDTTQQQQNSWHPQNNLAGWIQQHEEITESSSGHGGANYLNANNSVGSSNCSEKRWNLFRATDMLFAPSGAPNPSWPPGLLMDKERSVTLGKPIFAKPILARKNSRGLDDQALLLHDHYHHPNGITRMALDVGRRQVELEEPEKLCKFNNNKKETVISFKIRARQLAGTQKDNAMLLPLESRNLMANFNLLKSPAFQEEENELVAAQNQCIGPNPETFSESPSSSSSTSSDYSTETDNTRDQTTMRTSRQTSVKEESERIDDGETRLIVLPEAAEDIVIHKMKRHRNSNPGRRIHSGRVYDSVLGQTCHWCRQKTVELHCICKLCPIQYCAPCLLNRNGEKLHEEMSEGLKWICPKCRGGCGPGCDNCCNCGPCRKADGKMPTGQLVWTARSAGFDNVHDFLIHLGTGDAPEVIAQRKEGHEWTVFGRSGRQEAIQDLDIKAVKHIDFDTEMKPKSTSGAIVVHQGCGESLKYVSKTGRTVQGGMGGAVCCDGCKDISCNGFGSGPVLSKVKDEWDVADASLQSGWQHMHLRDHTKFNIAGDVREDRIESENSWVDLSACKRWPDEDMEQLMRSGLGKFCVKRRKVMGQKWLQGGEKTSAAVSAVWSVQAAMAGRISVEEPSIIMKHRDNFPPIKERRMSMVESMTGSFNQTATEQTRTNACRITKPDDHGNISSLLDETRISSKCRMPILSMECPVSQTSGTGNPVLSQVKMRENGLRPLQRSWPSQKLLDPMSAQHGSLFQESPKRFQGSECSRKLEAVLAQEFDENHLTDMLDLANIQDDLWHRICVGNEEEGSSYLDQYPDFALRLAEATGTEEKLSLLRGLFFLFQNSSLDGAFKPRLPESEPRSETTEQVTEGIVTVFDNQSLGCLRKHKASKVVRPLVHKIKELARSRDRNKLIVVPGTPALKMVLCLPAPLQYKV